MGSLTKAMIGKEDVDVQENELYPSTFNRLTSTGSTITLTSFPDVWKTHQDSINARFYGTQVGTTITAAVQAGTVCRDIYLDSGEWIVSNTVDWSSYTTTRWIFAGGAYLTLNAGVTVTFPSPANIIAQPNQKIFSGTGAVAFSTSGGGIYPAWWGCKGDGSTDDATAFQAMLTAKPNGFTVIDLGGLTYRIDSALTLVDKVKICNGKIDFSNAGEADLFTCTGTLGTALALTVNVAVGDNTVTMDAADAATLAEDDYVWLESASEHSTYYGATQGEHHRVKSILAGVVTLYDTAICEYHTADTATLTKINFKENIEFDNFEAEGDGVTLQQVCWFKYCRDVIIHRCKTTRFFYTHWRFLTSIKWTFENNSVSFTRPTLNGYGVCASEGCQFYHINNNFFEHCRQGIEAGAGTRGVNRYWTANFNEIVGSHAAGISTHSAAEFFEIRGNRISAKIGAAADSNGILVRAINGIVDGNHITHPNIWGIYWLPMISDLTDTRRGYIICTNNTIDFPYGKGIYIYQTTDIAINHVLVQGNTIYYASGGTGIHIRNDDGTIRNFIISNNSINALSGAYDCCRVESTAGSIQIGTITGNSFFRSDDLAFNIYIAGNAVLGANYISVVGNSIYNGSVGVKGANSDYVNVTGNVIMGCGDHYDGFGLNSVENHNIGA